MKKIILFFIFILFMSNILYAEISETEEVTFFALMNIDDNLKTLQYSNLFVEIEKSAEDLTKSLYTKIKNNNGNTDTIEYYDKYLLDYSIGSKETYNDTTIKYNNIIAKVNIIKEKPIYNNDSNPFKIKDGKLISYTGNSECVEVPQDVSVIGCDCFHDRKEIRQIKLPNTIKIIEHGAFCNCNNLQNINLPNSIETIGAAAFANCILLKEIILPNSIQEIPNFLFLASGVKKINIPSSVKYIGKFAFSECLNLTELTLNEGLIKIDEMAFNAIYINDLKIPNSVKEIGIMAFHDSNIVNLTLGTGLKKINLGVFSSNDLSSLHIPANIEIIDEEAFLSSCDNLKNIEFVEGLKAINDYAFLGEKSNVKKIIIPKSVEYLGVNSLTTFNNIDEIVCSKDINVQKAFPNTIKKITNK